MTIERRQHLASKILDVVADAQVGDWMYELGDCPAGKAYAGFLARLVEVRDEPALDPGQLAAKALDLYCDEAL